MEGSLVTGIATAAELAVARARAFLCRLLIKSSFCDMGKSEASPKLFGCSAVSEIM